MVQFRRMVRENSISRGSAARKVRLLPRELRDMIYDALVYAYKLDELCKWLNMPNLYKRWYGADSYKNEAVPYIVNPANVGEEFAQELTATIYKEIFTEYPARLRGCSTIGLSRQIRGPSLSMLVAADPFDVGVTPRDFLQKIIIQWDVSDIIRYSHYMNGFESDVRALPHLQPKKGLRLKVYFGNAESRKRSSFTSDPNSAKIADEFQALLEKLRPVYEHFKRNKIPCFMKLFMSRSRKMDLEGYFSKSPEKGWEFVKKKFQGS